MKTETDFAIVSVDSSMASNVNELPELPRPIEDWLTIGCAAEAIRMGDMVELNPANGRVLVRRG